MPMRRAAYRSAYRYRRRARAYRRRIRRRGVRVPRIRSRYRLHHFKVSRNVTWRFFTNTTTNQLKWWSLSFPQSLDWAEPSGRPKKDLTLRFAMFGDKIGNYFYPYDYYMISGVSVELHPMYITQQTPGTQGSTIIDKEGNINVQQGNGWDTDPFAQNSSRRTWQPFRRHRRFFIPKPTIQSDTLQQQQYSTYFLQGRNKVWINCQKDEVVHYGFALSLQRPTPDATYLINGTIVFYIKMMQFQGL
ncbi:capsid protein [Duck circovirus 3]|nr:capsid protein [Duck circovirus 3]